MGDNLYGWGEDEDGDKVLYPSYGLSGAWTREEPPTLPILRYVNPGTIPYLDLGPRPRFRAPASSWIPNLSSVPTPTPVLDLNPGPNLGSQPQP
ncbi:hypothetical protein TIFTF001_013300 [Ficus carica]|uniref:Uncharacterized protein n=1 Tax=Ficus carica TaxID=3494 RepID=A0AA88D2S0_FICCA|nr:hypothetical protein TIFTF001_013300 [Ficus carica]